MPHEKKEMDKVNVSFDEYECHLLEQAKDIYYRVCDDVRQ